MSKKYKGMLTNVLRRHGFIPVEKEDTLIFFKHYVKLGTVIVKPNGRSAILQIPDLGIKKEVNGVKKIDLLLKEIDSIEGL